MSSELCLLQRKEDRFVPEDLRKKNGIKGGGCWPGWSPGTALATPEANLLPQHCALHIRPALTLPSVQTMKVDPISGMCEWQRDGRTQILAPRAGHCPHRLQHHRQ